MARSGPRTLVKYTDEFKQTAVRLSHQPGMQVKTVAAALEIHPFMLSKWRKDAIVEMEIAHRLDPLSHVITLSLAMAYDGADRFADATPLYQQGLGQSPEAWYAWTARIGHEMALGRVDAAIDALQKSSGRSADRIALRGMVRGLRDLDSRNATIDVMSRSTIAGIRPLAIPFVRWLRGDSATLSMIDAAGVPWRENGGALIRYFYLGPRLRANARVRALAEREGFPTMDSATVREGSV